jgi:hypothetical protein
MFVFLCARHLKTFVRLILPSHKLGNGSVYVGAQTHKQNHGQSDHGVPRTVHHVPVKAQTAVPKEVSDTVERVERDCCKGNELEKVHPLVAKSETPPRVEVGRDSKGILCLVPKKEPTVKSYQTRPCPTVDNGQNGRQLRSVDGQMR